MNIATCANIIYQEYKKNTNTTMAKTVLQAFEDQGKDGTPTEVSYLIRDLESRLSEEDLTKLFQKEGESYSDFKEIMFSLDN